jgi:2-oxoglutarate dehydrogenase E2 component (dihydrolipoamide succinyltransferase)
MTIEIKVPVLPESIADATVATWLKQPGDFVAQDENIVDLETDKVVLEVPAPQDGVLVAIQVEEGATVLAEQVIATFKPGAADSAPKSVAQENTKQTVADDHLTPAVRRLVTENNVDVANLKGTGKDNRITKEDVETYMKSAATKTVVADTGVTLSTGARIEKREPMTRLRKRVAERLLEANNNTAMLTTFNEVNLQAVMDLRSKYKEKFEKSHDVRLGFMSFFTKACVEALKRFPSVNASIDGDDIVYHGYYDIGMAISTERGLVVPIVKDVDKLSFAQIESKIVDFAGRARAGKLSLDELTGGTFSITNGGVFGSMLSTPILNPPQSAILGMHNIQQRPVVEKGEIVIRPMMYLAVSYDHRIIDGKEAISFLVAIKEMLEDPSRLLLDV